MIPSWNRFFDGFSKINDINPNHNNTFKCSALLLNGKCKHQLIEVEGAVNITISVSVARNGDSKGIDFQKFSSILGLSFKVSTIISNCNKNAKDQTNYCNFINWIIEILTNNI
ncbi:hypothetical protein DDB_G0290475 [Dictyostelium discoideum AX4]|uniref:Uncharacterized protein n=1 Tax=Dictyostelium discoideum TaxID=44689 RepID=Q54G26_DICDI|nr:hypothetical protein DDB_G0290475 [Dictyostelium discoideum AX4]EAL62253.1 hypothetical protein DDB_G0290475 [Dictyostelium discoideum AX4]|eukprot:XP_635746.1 hypothetical protein DDB_G0290475 [Dictyostelium discoideum AX4]